MSEGDDAAANAAASENAWPKGFEMRPDGLHKLDPKATFRVCGPLEVPAMARTAMGGAWSLVLRFRDFDGRPKMKLLPRSSLIGDTFQPIRDLMDEGLDVLAPAALAQALHLMRPQRRVLALEQPGWSGPNYVFGEEVFGPRSDEGCIVINGRAAPPSVGDLKGWQTAIARLAIGNPRMILAICTALVGPLLRPLRSEGFGVHLNGKSSSGKSTLLGVAASMSGLEINTWRATDNGLEGEAQAANDGLLLLDELSEANPWHASASVFMLANGKGKARADRTGARKLRAEWRVVVLSSGELGLDKKLAETGRGQRPTAGQHVRLLDIPADAGRNFGVFEELHGFDDSAQLAQAVAQACKTQRGSAMRAYLAALCDDVGRCVEVAKTSRGEVLAELARGTLDAQAGRVAEQFAMLAAAGELASDLQITGWPHGTARDAAAALFRVWLDQRGRGGTDAVALVASWIEGQVLDPLANMRRKIFEKVIRGVSCWCIGVGIWREDVCVGQDPAAVARTLQERGLLVHDEGRLQAKVRPNDGEKTEPINVYAVSKKILQLDD